MRRDGKRSSPTNFMRRTVQRQILKAHVSDEVYCTGSFAVMESVVTKCWNIKAFKRWCSENHWDCVRDKRNEMFVISKPVPKENHENV